MGNLGDAIQTRPVKVRIAPSPTGKMHVGTARTALFNKLFALSVGGEFCVRIEDTDAARSTLENMTFLQDALAWLGLTPDGDYVIQSANIGRHQAAAEALLHAGSAYEDADGVVRFKVPAGRTGWEDAIQGRILVEHEQIEDFALLRSDGTPTYHLGVVVDDADMQITHVLRGDDHLNNTPKQILLYHALFQAGWLKENVLPIFGHIPLIYGEDGQKLSKRHGAVSVQDLRAEGILRDALLHYLMMLSWLAGDALTPLTVSQAAAQFDLKAIKKNPPTFDPTKLLHINGIYLQKMPALEVLDALLGHAAQHGQSIPDAAAARLMKVMPALTQRAHTLHQLLEAAQPFIANPPFVLDAEAQAAWAEGQGHIAALLPDLTEAEWDPNLLQQIIKDYVKDNDLKFPIIGKALRAALIGQLQGPGLGDIFNALGRTETLRRLG